MEIEISAKQPFSLASVINSHGWAQLAPFQTEESEVILSYTIRLNHRRVIKLDIREIFDGVSIELSDPASVEEQDQIKSAVTWMLALNDDFENFYQHTRSEPKLRHVEKEAQGRLLRSPTVFEDTIKTILTTNTSWAGTIRMTESLVSHFGDPLTGIDNRYSFPCPERIANCNEQILRKEVKLGYRAPYILELARDVDSGKLLIEEFKSSGESSDQLHKKLTDIKGVGKYAAANLMILLGHYEFLPIDSWALKVVSQEFYNGGQIGEKEVAQIFEPWGEWKGLVYWLWDWSKSEP